MAVGAMRHPRYPEILERPGRAPANAKTAMAMIAAGMERPATTSATLERLADESSPGLPLGIDFTARSEMSPRRMEESPHDDREEFGRTLFDRDANLFGRFPTALFYDLAKHRAAGSPSFAKPRRRHTCKERRDFPLKSMGALLDSNGHALRTALYPGVTSGPETLKILNPPAGAPVVPDGGEDPEKYVSFLAGPGRTYFAAGRTAGSEADFGPDAARLKEPGQTVATRLVDKPPEAGGGRPGERRLYCRAEAIESGGREDDTRRNCMFEEALDELNARLGDAGGPAGKAKAEREAEALEKERQAAGLHAVTIDARPSPVGIPDHHASGASRGLKSPARKKPAACESRVVRTDDLGLGEADIWRKSLSKLAFFFTNPFYFLRLSHSCLPTRPCAPGMK
jgi:hypothetical protein